MVNKYIEFKEKKFHYYTAGTGADAIIAIHGYGETGAHFYHLAQHIPEGFKMIAIDLPWHGKTGWNDRNQFFQEDLFQVINKLILEENCANGKVVLLGYSLGGRIALSLFEKYPQFFRSMILIAPDGFRKNFWYWFATKTWFGRMLFTYTLKYPAWLQATVKLFSSLGLITTGLKKFIKFHIDERSARDALHIRWMGLRAFQPNLSNIKSFIKKYEVKVEIIYGKNDRIISYKAGQRFARGLEEFCTVHILEGGHRLLLPEFVALYGKVITSVGES
jgi:pimeloyl-ACP methyl ester carboxylesterase